MATSVEEINKMEEGECRSSTGSGFCGSNQTVQMIQKIIAEVVGTYILIFAGCASVILHKQNKDINFTGVALVWGSAVLVMIYSVGHISGAHFNPTVTVTFAIFRQFPIKQVPLYIIAQFVGSFLASGSLYLLYEPDENAYFGTTPAGSHVQSLVVEIITTFLLLFVASAVATDNRAIGELAGIALGTTIMVDVFIAGPISGASMNPARSIGPAVIMHVYKGLWIYVVGPFVGALVGGFCYNLIRFTDKPLREISKSASFLKRTKSVAG
ncbi:hypothetical protein L6164_026744 [Bauhinia variegata]|uniref:Uncharacterized protein n=1 Tax=Bauhinia variegata TaxID=167791 RepID=A0ACB9LRD8_BAUVA|nr:hypothetical protein L6164_026744 [Bauhinia variegata]